MLSIAQLNDLKATLGDAERLLRHHERVIPQLGFYQKAIAVEVINMAMEEERAETLTDDEMDYYVDTVERRNFLQLRIDFHNGVLKNRTSGMSLAARDARERIRSIIREAKGL